MLNWIYNLIDYRRIFALSDIDLQKSILDYPGGISSVNAELYALGYRMVSSSPDYHLATNEMEQRAHHILETNISYLQQHLDILSTTDSAAANQIIQQWRHSTGQFLADYPLGKQQGRYQAIDPVVSPPDAPTSELLLCADLLFSPYARSNYPAQELMDRLCRLAVEVRVFPLLEQKNVIATELGPIILAFQQRNFGVEVRAVDCCLRRDANAMLRIWAKECEVNS